VSDADIEGLDLSSWRIAINAAEPVLAHTIEAFTKRFEPHGFRPEAMTPAWGLAENVTIATAHPIAEAPRVETIDRQVLAQESVAVPVSNGEEGISSTAIGQVLPHCHVEVRDPKSGEPLPERGVGRVWLSTNSLFSHYHRAAEATALALVDGWLDTGDEGYLCGSDLFFVSRDKDLIVIGGDKYAPHDIETLINEVSGVRQGCVVTFGILSQARGTEELAAIIETRETDAAKHKEIERAARKKVLTTTGIPLRHVLIVPAGGVEKTTSGKLARRATRARYADRLPRSDS
jgi:acyl-CoA synthetase (AMP-forming)/AMP-acid ligase II